MYDLFCFQVNAIWKQVQIRASAKQAVLERCVQEQTQNLESARQQEVTAFTENFSFLRSLYLTPACDEDGVCGRRKKAVEPDDDMNDVEQFYDEELKNQFEVHELFEGLASVEESAVTEVVLDGDLMRYQEPLSRLQVSES